MHLEMVEPLLPRLAAPGRKREDPPAKPTPEIELAVRMDMAVLQVPGVIILNNAVNGGEMCFETRFGVEGCAALGASIVNQSAAAPHLFLTVVSVFVLAPIGGCEEGFAANVSAAVGFV